MELQISAKAGDLTLGTCVCGALIHTTVSYPSHCGRARLATHHSVVSPVPEICKHRGSGGGEVTQSHEWGREKKNQGRLPRRGDPWTGSRG